MKTHFPLRAIVISLVLASGTGAALAESTYGYSSTGTGVVTATARVNLSVTVPKLILLKVGTSGATIDTLSWTTGFAIPATPTTPVNGTNVAVPWSGAAPTVPALTNPAAVPVAAWSNSTGSTINCSATAFATAGGPALTDFTASAGAGTLPHPGGTLGACTATAAIAANTLVSSNWTYTLGGTPTNWLAGAYTSVVTYTATSL